MIVDKTFPTSSISKLRIPTCAEISGTSSDDTLYGGVAWIGSNIYAGGADHDFIELHDYGAVGIHDFASLQAHMHDTLPGVVIDLGNGNEIMLQNVYTHQLTAADFHIF